MEHSARLDAQYGAAMDDDARNDAQYGATLDEETRTAIIEQGQLLRGDI